jgi:hypothetical protein
MSRITLYLPRRIFRTAFGFQRAVPAVIRAGPVNEHVVLVRPGGGLKHLALRADIDIALFVEAEVFARESAILPLAHVPDRDALVAGECGLTRGSTLALFAAMPPFSGRAAKCAGI